eukprot:TRINITY_DN13816_c1_g1_i2.p3 TRINITY_DN13816_c1_g1~~TRINITY_DN13816_c1_g1_i2.p3  ORF type:complete len:143 (+),score=3.22 TRINITY_DN13816_c1_g1_i2:655-1083(+)
MVDKFGALKLYVDLQQEQNQIFRKIQCNAFQTTLYLQSSHIAQLKITMQVVDNKQICKGKKVLWIVVFKINTNKRLKTKVHFYKYWRFRNISIQIQILLVNMNQNGIQINYKYNKYCTLFGQNQLLGLQNKVEFNQEKENLI